MRWQHLSGKHEFAQFYDRRWLSEAQRYDWSEFCCHHISVDTKQHIDETAICVK